MSRLHPGHGIGLRPKHYGQLLESGASGVAWFEAISEDFFVPGGRPWAVLERVRSDVPVVLHGVGMGLGNSDALSERYFASLEQVIARIEPAWVSDHLAWSAIAGKYTHDLLPVPYTEETLGHVAQRILAAEERLRRPLLIENPSAYMTFAEATIPEHEFLRELCRRTGCYVLLDVNNVVVCAKNLGIDPIGYVEGLDPASVAQIHLAGHTDYGDHAIDTHVGPVPEEVWALYRRAVRRFGAVPTLVEWDEDVPALDVVAREARRAGRIEDEELGSALERAS